MKLILAGSVIWYTGSLRGEGVAAGAPAAALGLGFDGPASAGGGARHRVAAKAVRARRMLAI